MRTIIIKFSKIHVCKLCVRILKGGYNKVTYLFSINILLVAMLSSVLFLCLTMIMDETANAALSSIKTTAIGIQILTIQTVFSSFC